MIPNEILEKYKMRTLEDFKKFDGNNIWAEIGFYQTFLIQTDHIPNKIIEAQILNEEIDDYTEILNYRKFARQEINRLQAIEQEVSE